MRRTVPQDASRDGDTMTEPFRWKNCRADVGTSMHGQIVQAFLREVVNPALATLDRQLAELEGRQGFM